MSSSGCEFFTTYYDLQETNRMRKQGKSSHFKLEVELASWSISPRDVHSVLPVTNLSPISPTFLLPLRLLSPEPALPVEIKSNDPQNPHARSGNLILPSVNVRRRHF